MCGAYTSSLWMPSHYIFILVMKNLLEATLASEKNFVVTLLLTTRPNMSSLFVYPDFSCI